MSFAFLSIVTVSVDYGLVQVAFQPLIGEAYRPTSAGLETLVVLALQAALIIASTRATTRVNNTAVATEVIGIARLARLEVWQDGRRLATGVSLGMKPDRPVRLGASWTSRAGPGGGPVTVRLA